MSLHRTFSATESESQAIGKPLYDSPIAPENKESRHHRHRLRPDMSPLKKSKGKERIRE